MKLRPKPQPHFQILSPFRGELRYYIYVYCAYPVSKLPAKTGFASRYGIAPLAFPFEGKVSAQPTDEVKLNSFAAGKHN